MLHRNVPNRQDMGPCDIDGVCADTGHERLTVSVGSVGMLGTCSAGSRNNKSSSFLHRTLLLHPLLMVFAQEASTLFAPLDLVNTTFTSRGDLSCCLMRPQAQFLLDLDRGNKALSSKTSLCLGSSFPKVRLAGTLGCISSRRILGRYAQPTIRYADSARNLLRSILQFGQLPKANGSNSSSARRFT